MSGRIANHAEASTISKILKMVSELAKEAGLRVIIQVYARVGSGMGGQRIIPDGLFEAQNGDKIIPQVAPGYCIDNQVSSEAFVKFYEEAAKVAIQL